MLDLGLNIMVLVSLLGLCVGIKVFFYVIHFLILCNEITNHPPLPPPTMPLILSAAAEDLHASER